MFVEYFTTASNAAQPIIAKDRNIQFYNEKWKEKKTDILVFVLYNPRTPLIIWVAWVTHQERHEMTAN